jgi:Fic family protein
MKAALNDMEEFIHQESEFPPLVRQALIHYQFEAIHPFSDVNGRIGRLLITLMLCSDQLIPQPLLYLSAFFEKYRDDYYRLLLEVSQKGKWKEWILFFLEGVEVQAIDALKKSKELMDLREDYRKEMQKRHASSTAMYLIDNFFSQPYSTITLSASRIGLSYHATRTHFKKLEEIGIISEITGRKRGRVYLAEKIFSIIEPD